MFDENVYNTPPNEDTPSWEEIENEKANKADDWYSEQIDTDELQDPERAV